LPRITLAVNEQRPEYIGAVMPLLSVQASVALIHQGLCEPDTIDTGRLWQAELYFGFLLKIGT
jgi:hypothetical protein